MPSSNKEIKILQGQNIVEIPQQTVQKINPYEPSKVKDSKGLRYSTLQDAFESQELKKNARFRLDDLVRNPLSVTQEEENRVQQEIAARLEEKLTEIRQEATKEAYAAGFLTGKEEANKQMREEAAPVLKKFEDLIQQLETIRAEIFKANEDLILKLIYYIAKEVILKELKEDADYVKRLMVHLIERIGTRENMKLYIGQAEIAAAEKIKQDLAHSLGELKNISIEVDPAINDRGCRLETEFGEINATIETQLLNISKQLGVTK